MKFFSYVFFSLTLFLLSGCASNTPVSDLPNVTHINELSDANVLEITHNIEGGTMPVEVGAMPNWTLPAEIKPAQFKNAYRLYETVYFGIILQPNSSFFLPDETERQLAGPVQFAGIIFTQDDGKTWNKFFEIRSNLADESGPVHPNAVGIFWQEGRYYVDIADDRGAGSGEGILTRYWTSDARNWTREAECHYFNPDTYYNDDSYELPTIACPDYLNEI